MFSSGVPIIDTVTRMDSAGEPPTIAEGLYSFDIGGGERIGADVAVGFARRGYRVVCFGMYGSQGPLRPQLQAAGIPCFDLVYTSRARLTRRITYPLEFARFLRRERVRALHMHYGTSLLIAGRGARLARVPRVVVTEHALHQFQENPKYRDATIRAAHFASAITVVHADQANYWINTLRVPRERLHYVPNGVTIPVEAPARNTALRASLGIAPGDFLFLAIGRLHETKDLPTLLAAIEQLSASESRARLWLVGDGAERPLLEGIIRDRKLGQRVTLLGERTDIAAILAAGDALVMSSRTEGMPMALIEAMASRVPCIATAVGGVPHLLRGEAGLLAPPRDPAALAAAMRRVMTDAALRERLVAEGLARVRADHDLENSVTRYLELLGLPPTWPARA